MRFFRGRRAERGKPGLRGQTIGYLLVLAASFVLAMIAGWLGARIDNGAYDWMFRKYQPPAWAPQSVVLAIDERTLNTLGGMRRVRQFLAEGLERVAGAKPRVVAIDLILADEDSAHDAALEAAFRKLPNLALACELVDRRWEDPLPRFRRWAAAVGHVHADPGPLDGVSRQAPLEKVGGREQRWALALEAYRLSRGAGQIMASPDDLEVGGVTVPARWADSRAMRIRYLPPAPDGGSRIPRVSLADLQGDPRLAERFRDKVVFVGVTGQSAPDRFLTPYSEAETTPGVEIHANVFETLARGQFLRGASNLAVVGFCLLLAAAAVATFAFLTGWQAYTLAGALLASAHLVPYALFTRDIVFPYFAPVSAAWLSVVGAGAFQFVMTRRQLRRSEAERARYQQAMHFVTHEMRTPLTAIQGSSELMSRYKLSDEKRKQIADLIHSESRRLARMIETFLNVERLSAGQMELKKEVFQAGDLLAACVERVRPVAERKQIRLRLAPVGEAAMAGDRELMEYAVYNLLTNAVKYSPANTEVTAAAGPDGDYLRISVTDQGIGMDQHELKNIFQRFYRTRGAESSGEKGTGIGLSIVEQIVGQHGGRIEVTSAPGKGSCFTVVVPKSEKAAETQRA